MLQMNPTFAIALTVLVVGVVAYALLRFISGSRAGGFDAGVVSQSWLTQHRAGKQDDRFQ